MLTTLYDYQILGVRRIKRYGGRALLADEPGLGKTLQFLTYMHRNPHLRPAVVVCPAGLKYNWEHEAMKHLGMRAEVLESTRPHSLRPRVVAPLYIVNYGILGRRGGERAGQGWNAWLKDLQPKVIGIDECQAISNRSALQTKWVRELCRGVPHVVAMSGTPLTNRPAELWSVLNLLRPDMFPYFKHFANEFCDVKYHHWGPDYRGAKNLPELHAILTHPERGLMIRRRKADVLRELPEKRRSVVPLPLSDPKQYRHALRDFLSWLSKNAPDRVYTAMRAQRLTQVGYLKRLAARLKLPYVIEWVDAFLQGSEGKLILFAIHEDIMDALHDRYRQICVRVDGSTPNRERQRMADAFQQNRSIRLFLGNIQAAGKGLTLTAATTVAFAELPWVPGEFEQCESRPHRIGQQNCVDVVALVARDTIEERLAWLLQDKAATLAGVLDGREDGGDLDIHDALLRSLLSGPASSRELEAV